MIRRWGPWVALGLVLAVTLVVGTRDRSPVTIKERVTSVTDTVRCPTCRSQSAADSDAPAAQAIRAEVERRVRAGESDGEIRSYLVSRYGKDILLKPEATGLAALVWAIPVVVVVGAAAGLAIVLARRRPAPSRERGRRRSVPTVVTVAGIVLVAVLAGAFVASSSGERLAGRPLSGAIGSTTAGKLAEAARLAGQGEALAAVKLYDEVLATDPTNVQALTYRGWLVRLAGLSGEGLAYIDRAIATDPTYPDAHLFRGLILYQDRNDPAAAVGELEQFLASDPPEPMVPMVQGVLEQARAAASTTR